MLIPISPHDLSPEGKPVALLQVLERADGKRLTVYTESCHAFATTHIHRAIYSERGFLITEEKEIKNKKAIISLLKALTKPKAVAIVHCQGHKGPTLWLSRGIEQLTKKLSASLWEICPNMYGGKLTYLVSS